MWHWRCQKSSSYIWSRYWPRGSWGSGFIQLAFISSPSLGLGAFFFPRPAVAIKNPRTGLALIETLEIQYMKKLKKTTRAGVSAQRAEVRPGSFKFSAVTRQTLSASPWHRFAICKEGYRFSLTQEPASIVTLILLYDCIRGCARKLIFWVYYKLQPNPSIFNWPDDGIIVNIRYSLCKSDALTKKTSLSSRIDHRLTHLRIRFTKGI